MMRESYIKTEVEYKDKLINFVTLSYTYKQKKFSITVMSQNEAKQLISVRGSLSVCLAMAYCM